MMELTALETRRGLAEHLQRGDAAVAGIDREPSKLLEESAALISAKVSTETQANLEASASVSFWASAFKEVIVFASILPVLLWRSLRDPHSEEH